MDEMPELDVDILTVVLNRTTGRVEVNYDGMNYLEAIGALTVARNQVEETAFDIEWDGADDGED